MGPQRREHANNHPPAEPVVFQMRAKPYVHSARVRLASAVCQLHNPKHREDIQMEVNDSNSLSHMQLADRTSSIARGAFSSSPLNLFATTGLAVVFLVQKLHKNQL